MTALQAGGKNPIERWFGPWPAQLAWFLAFSLLTRFTMLGDPNYHEDEALFFLIGQRMLDGLWPYADIWDRKGPGLFTLYALFAGISRSVLSYQIGALIAAALTGFTVNRIAFLFTGRLGALLAGTLYLALLPLFMGGGGQAAVFFNLPIVIAAWMVLSAPSSKVPTMQTTAAMLIAGIAATFKQTCLFDGAFLGCLLLWRHWQAGADWPALLSATLRYAVAGALPMLAFFAVFALAGHFAELWHALVWSNLDKEYDPGGNSWERIKPLALIISPAIPLVAAGLALRLEHDGKQAPRVLLTIWLLVALAGMAVIPNFIDHYMLPICLILSICAAPALQRAPIGMFYGYGVIILGLIAGPAFHAERRADSKEAMAQLAAEIEESSAQPRPFIFQGPIALYSMVESYPPSPLILPLHLFYEPERNTSYLDTAGEVRRILDWQPTVVVTFHEQPGLVNPETRDLVFAYVQSNCRFWGTRKVPDRYAVKLYDVWGDCNQAAR